TLDGWRQREAKIGRVYSCDNQTISGFPFRIEVRCTNPSAEFRTTQPTTALKWKDLLVVANVFSPTRLVGEITGRMMIGEVGSKAAFKAEWREGTVTVRGLPTNPDGGTVTLVEPNVERLLATGTERVFNAKQADLDGRIVEGSALSNPVIE